VFRLVDESPPPVAVGDAASINHDLDEEDESIDVLEQNVDEDTVRRLDDNANHARCSDDDQHGPVPPLCDDDQLNKNSRLLVAESSHTPGNTIQVTANAVHRVTVFKILLKTYFFAAVTIFCDIS